MFQYEAIQLCVPLSTVHNAAIWEHEITMGKDYAHAVDDVQLVVLPDS